MSKTFNLNSKFIGLDSISFDGIHFAKSVSGSEFGMLLSDVDNSALSLSSTFELSKLKFSTQTISNEVFECVSFSVLSGEFEYVFDNDEMLAQFCDFYGLGC
ncbi:hypothetical protein [Aliivibrio salmonicida]|uniref:hypothetical protein n=1 Tax=Aliivibrio salmonicida TaxID=40269 RepID=UPI003D140C51